MGDATGLAEKMLGLDGFRVLEIAESKAEMVIHVETVAIDVLCAGCGGPAEAQDRVSVEVRDLPCFHRATRLIWRKRRWRCRVTDCSVRTWTEDSDHLPERQLLTRRAGAEACRQVGRLGRSVASVAEELGVCWATAMAAVEHHGRPLIDDPKRVGRVRSLGVDETSWLRAKRDHPTLYATGLVDLERRRMIDMVRGRAASDLRRWCKSKDEKWLGGVKVVAMDLTESYRNGLNPHLSHARRVADPFHVVRVANRAVDLVRRRVQNETLGHTAGESTIRSIASESFSSQGPNDSTTVDVTGSFSGSESVTRTTSSSVCGWRRSR